MPKVRLPNGTLLNFPEGMSEDEMRDAIYKNYPEYATQTPSNDSSGILSGALKEAGQFGLGGLQGIAKAGQGLGQLETGLINKLLGTQLKAPAPDVYGAVGVQPDTAARLGEMVGGTAPTVVAGELPASLGGKALAYGLSGAATEPGSAFDRAFSGATSAAIPAITTLFSKLPGAYTAAFPQKLAKHLEKVHGQQQDISRALYDKAFENTENIAPTISENSRNILQELGKEGEGNKAFRDAIKSYNKKNDIESYHRLRSDLRKIESKLASKSEKSGLTGAESDKMSLIREALPSIDEDLSKSLAQISPQKYADYKAAQSHYRNNIVPFKTLKAVRDILSPERKITPLLSKKLQEESVSAGRLRDILNLSRPQLSARDLARNLSTLGLGAGGLYELTRLLGERR